MLKNRSNNDFLTNQALHHVRVLASLPSVPTEADLRRFRGAYCLHQQETEQAVCEKSSGDVGIEQG